MTGKDMRIIDSERIESNFFSIPGHRVMLDFDLAKLYEVKTKVLKIQFKATAAISS
ncbi:MAG: ORF6N domain-containing protein [Candidatus Riflebacteria bacterium]